MKTKANLIIDIHNNKVKNLKLNKINEDDYNKDNDETWLKEINKKEDIKKSVRPQNINASTKKVKKK